MHPLKGTVAAVAWLLVVAAGSPAIAQGGEAALIETDIVTTEPLAQTQPVVGRLVATDNSTVAARIEGPVQAVHVEVGDRVDEGMLLAELDIARLRAERDLRQAEVEESSARLRAGEATVSLYRQDLQRLQGLRGSAAFSQARYEDALAEVERALSERTEAEASLSRSRVALALAELELGYARIAAPFPGVVSRRFVDVGEYVDIGAPIVSLVNDEDLEIEAAVPAGLIASLRADTIVHVRLDDGSEVEAAVRAVVPIEDPLTRTRRVRFTPNFAGHRLQLADGQSAIVFVPVAAPREAVTVHKDAVISSPAGQTVFRVVDGRAEPQPVEIGEAVGNRFEVIGGLAPGDVVVIRGNENLRPGQAVQVGG